MLQDLTKADIEKLKGMGNAFKLMHLLFLAFAVIISFLSGILGIKSGGYLPTAGFTFLLLLLLYLIYFSIKYIAYRKDLYQQRKATATVKVIKKSSKQSEKTVWTNQAAFKRIEVLNEEAFGLIHLGDELYVEQTVNSKFLLKLQKEGKDLLKGS